MKNFGESLNFPSKPGKMEIEAEEERLKWTEVPNFSGINYKELMESLRADNPERLKPDLTYAKLKRFIELSNRNEPISPFDDIYLTDSRKQAA